MRGRVSTLLMLIVGLGVGSADAQHDGRQTPGQPTPGTQPDAQLVSACVQSQQQAAAIADQVGRRLEAARQTNSAADMRAAMDDLQTALSQMRTSLQACNPLQAAAQPADPHAGHTMGSVKQSPGAAPQAPVMQPGSGAPVASAPAAGAPASKPGAGMDHAAMGHGTPAASPKPGVPAPPTDHSKMGHAVPADKPAASPAGKATAPASPSDRSKMDHAAPATKPADKPAQSGAKPATPGQPMDHSKMSMGGSEPKAGDAKLPVMPAERVMDPACPNVDTKIAPNATYQRKVYYFCSAKDRDEFVKNPAAYLKKRPKG